MMFDEHWWTHQYIYILIKDSDIRKFEAYPSTYDGCNEDTLIISTDKSKYLVVNSFSIKRYYDEVRLVYDVLCMVYYDV